MDNERQVGMEIEVTEAMIEAGENAYLRYGMEVGDVRDLVQTIFEQMQEASPANGKTVTACNS